jgi:hypothetical protein
VKCAECGESIRRIAPGDGYDLYLCNGWTHDSEWAGGPYCDNGWYDEREGQWHDETWALPDNPAPLDRQTERKPTR